MSYKASSFLSAEINSYIKFRENSGYKQSSFNRELNRFDKYLIEKSVQDDELTYELVNAFIYRKDGRSSSTMTNEWSVLKGFFNYLYEKGYRVPLLQNSDIPVKRRFFPHIYTTDEVSRYFEAADSYKSTKSWLPELQVPVIFRLLYCCGLRISECLSLKKKDIDFTYKAIILRETKFGNQRSVLMNEDIFSLLKKFADKRFYQLKSDDYIFQSRAGTKLTSYAIHKIHKVLLEMAGIPFLGGGKGPRVHDWRHTFAVCSLHSMLDSNISFDKAVQLLSEVMGHTNVLSTEYFLRETIEAFPETMNKLTEYLELYKYEN